MFKTAPDTGPAPVEVAPADLVPLSHLALDLPQPAEGWADFLGRRAIAFVPDDLGRDCVRRQDARRLLDEQRENELRKAKLRQLAEQEAVEADRQFRASLPRGLPWYEIPDGVPPVVAMTAADKPPSRGVRRATLSGCLVKSTTRWSFIRCKVRMSREPASTTAVRDRPSHL